MSTSLRETLVRSGDLVVIRRSGQVVVWGKIPEMIEPYGITPQDFKIALLNNKGWARATVATILMRAKQALDDPEDITGIGYVADVAKALVHRLHLKLGTRVYVCGSLVPKSVSFCP